jgi:hypothetical protein
MYNEELHNLYSSQNIIKGEQSSKEYEEDGACCKHGTDGK